MVNKRDRIREKDNKEKGNRKNKTKIKKEKSSSDFSEFQLENSSSGER